MIEVALLVLTLFSTPYPLTPQEGTVTLYSVNKYKDQRQACLKFPRSDNSYVKTCDVRYGGLYVGDNLDWFESSGAFGHRSVIKDLGAQRWNDQFTVPVVEPLPKLKPGEQRHVTIDASGAPGAPGAPGVPGRDGRSGSTAEKLRPTHEIDLMDTEGRLHRAGATERKPREPKVDPMFVKALPGHMYVIHVVDDVGDFYVLFRVESLERGDNCAVSWRLIPSPENTTQKQK